LRVWSVGGGGSLGIGVQSWRWVNRAALGAGDKGKNDWFYETEKGGG